jgi:FkbM family methyltransferase
MNLLKKCKHGMMIYNHHDVFQGTSFSQYGEYSEYENFVFGAIIKQGDVVLDIGANIGSFTVVFARLTGPKGVVLAFEPERHSHNCLCGNVAINNLKNVYIYNNAIGKETKTKVFPDNNPDEFGNHGGFCFKSLGNNKNGYPVSIVSLDSLKLENIDFIKIDVEGMEPDVIEGGKETIKKLKPIIHAETDRQPASDETIKLLKDLGYKTYNSTTSLFNPSNFYQNSKNHLTNPEGLQYITSNCLAIHKSKQMPIDLAKFNLIEI